MNFEDILKERLNKRDIMYLCAACCDAPDDSAKTELFSLAGHPDDRIGYNALWVFTHFPPKDIAWLQGKRDALIETVLHTRYTGRRRLALTLLQRLPAEAADMRTDYLDFCLSKINSAEPYAIRALCLRQAFARCRLYPELMSELKAVTELMESAPLSSGLRCARRQILQKMAALD